MRSLLMVAALVLSTSCAESTEQTADLLVTNARVLTGSGTVIPNGSILIHEGRIEAIREGEVTEKAARVIDADGRTVLPGLIDTHRHFLGYAFAMSAATNEAEIQNYIDTELPGVLKGLLSAGLTTVMVPTDFVPEIFEVRQRLSEGDLIGPRLLAAGRAFTGPGGHPAGSGVCDGDPFCRSRCAVELDDPDLVRAEVKKDVEMGADFIKVIVDRYIVPDTVIDDGVFEAIAKESDALGVPLLVHSSNVDELMTVVEKGADKLVHAPSGSIEESEADLLVQSGVPVATTVAYASPAFAEATGQPWNENEYRQILDNIRFLVDSGVVVAFGTDNPPQLGWTEFMYEVKALGTVLSPLEVIESMTIQAARFLDIDDRLGTLEPGKVADLVIVDGDPLEDLSSLANVVVVVKEGRIMADKR